MSKLTSKRVRLANILIRQQSALITKQLGVLRQFSDNNNELVTLLETKDELLAEFRQLISHYNNSATSR